MPSSTNQGRLFRNQEEFCDIAVPLLFQEDDPANHLMESGFFVNKEQIAERNELQQNEVTIPPQPQSFFDWGHFWVGFQIGLGVAILVSALILIGEMVLSYCTIQNFINTVNDMIILKVFLSLAVWFLFRLTGNGRLSDHHGDDTTRMETQCYHQENPGHEFDNKYDNAQGIWFTLGVCLGLIIIDIVIKFPFFAWIL